jgi:hypothetical protein
MTSGIRRITIHAALLALTSATSRGQGPVAAGLPGFDHPVRLDTLNSRRTMAGNRVDTFRATRAAFEALKIPMTHVDSARGYLVNLEYTRMRTLAGHRMSELLNCGLGFNGPNADEFRITMAIAGIIEPHATDQATLRVAFAAGARSVEGVSKPPVACASTGVLENRIVQFVQNRLKTG